MQVAPVLLCFGDLHWNNGYERNHSFIKNLLVNGLFERAVYIEPSEWISNLLNNRQYSLLFADRKRSINGNVDIKQPIHFMPFKNKFSFLNTVENIVLKKSIVKALRGDTYVLLINRVAIDIEEILIDLIKNSEFSIFDFSDDFREFCKSSKDVESYQKFINLIVPKMNLVMHVNKHVESLYSYLNTNNMVVRNATNYDNFVDNCFYKVPEMESLLDKYTHIVGYVGTANLARLDIEAIKNFVNKKDDYAFVFVGNTEEEVKISLANCKHIYYQNFVPYTMLPSYINYFTVCTAPMLINKHTAGNDLLKLHDYLAMGKPVVTSDTGGAGELSEVYVYRSSDDFVEKIELSIRENSNAKIASRKVIASSNSWNNRLEPLRSYLQSYAITVQQ